MYEETSYVLSLSFFYFCHLRYDTAVSTIGCDNGTGSLVASFLCTRIVCLFCFCLIVIISLYYRDRRGAVRRLNASSMIAASIPSRSNHWSESTSCFLRDIPPVFMISSIFWYCFRRSTEVSSHLSNTHFCFIIPLSYSFITESLDLSKPSELIFFFVLTVTSLLVPTILFISSLQFRWAKLTLHIGILIFNDFSHSWIYWNLVNYLNL